MSLTIRRVGIVGSRDFKNYRQLKETIDALHLGSDDEIVSGGAIGADSMAQRYAKESGHDIHIYYPKYAVYGKPATFIRNKLIAENSDIVIAFYQKGRFQLGGTSNTIHWCKELGVPYEEYEED